MLRGIDVSAAQGNIDWLNWSPVDFVYAKCGNGNDVPDPTFLRNSNGARSRGARLGAYHVYFAIPATPEFPSRDPVAQARAHFNQCGGYGSGGGELPIMTDLEWPAPGTPDWTKYNCTVKQVQQGALAYLAECERLYGCLPILYNGWPDYWKVIGEGEPAFARYPAFIVDYPLAYTKAYPPDNSLLVVPKPFTKAVFWQSAGGGGTIPVLYPDGTRGTQPVDLDVFLGDETEMTALCAKP